MLILFTLYAIIVSPDSAADYFRSIINFLAGAVHSILILTDGIVSGFDSFAVRLAAFLMLATGSNIWFYRTWRERSKKRDQWFLK